MNLDNSVYDSFNNFILKGNIMFNSIKAAAQAAATKAAQVATIAAGVAVGTLAAAKLAEMLKSGE